MRRGRLALALCWMGGTAVLGQEPVVGDAGRGKRLFDSQCSVCHGEGGTGGRGPALTRPVLDKAPDEGALRKAISEGLQPEMPAAWQLSPREVADVAAYVRSLGTVKPESLPGDVGRGAAVYQAKGCAGCHILGGRGSGVGPELTGIGAKRNAAYLRESVRRPAASLPEDYLLVEAVFADGKVIRGMRANEDPFTLQLRDLKSGEYRSYRKRDLKDVRRLSKESSMPAYPVGSISDSELEDLVAYLASQRGSR